jgi:hypothetical protein
MTLSKGGLVVVAVCLAAAAGASNLLAQPGQKASHAARMYDAKAEGTFKGVVQTVENIAHPGRSGRRSLGGTHLQLKTATETLEVHLGPAAFQADKHLTVAAGDELEIVGSRVAIGGEPVLLAREIRKGTDTWTLRDEAGRPAWGGRRW